MKVVDRISDGLALLAAILMFATGVFLTWEVGGRYLFGAPTTWAQEVSELCLLWAVFLAVAAMIRRRQNIAIDVLFAAVPRPAQRMFDIIALVFVLVFLVLTARSGFEIAWESYWRGSTTGTMVDIPIFWEEAAVPVGCAWAALQTIIEIGRAIIGRDWSPHLNEAPDV
jgi:TRAP-type C4-dicarboxylate transport system permease small subunit